MDKHSTEHLHGVVLHTAVSPAPQIPVDALTPIVTVPGNQSLQEVKVK